MTARRWSRAGVSWGALAGGSVTNRSFRQGRLRRTAPLQSERIPLAVGTRPPQLVDLSVRADVVQFIRFAAAHGVDVGGQGASRTGRSCVGRRTRKQVGRVPARCRGRPGPHFLDRLIRVDHEHLFRPRDRVQVRGQRSSAGDRRRIRSGRQIDPRPAARGRQHFVHMQVGSFVKDRVRARFRIVETDQRTADRGERLRAVGQRDIREMPAVEAPRPTP